MSYCFKIVSSLQHAEENQSQKSPTLPQATEQSPLNALITGQTLLTA